MKRTLVGSAFAEESHRHPVFSHFFGGQCRTAGDGHAGTDDATAAELMRVIKQMHMTAFAFAQPRDFAKHLGGHGVQGHALGNGKVVRPVGAHHGVLIIQVRTNAHRYGLLPCSQMHLTWNRTRTNVKRQTLLDGRRQLAFHVSRRHGFFIEANLVHLFKHPQQLFFADLHCVLQLG